MSLSEHLDLPHQCVQCAVRNRSLCAILAPGELHALNSVKRVRHVEPGQVIVTEGEPDILCNVMSGLLAEKKTLADGREQIVSLLFPADFHAKALDEIADTSLHAVSATTVCVFDRIGFEELQEDFPALKQAVLEYALKALCDAREWMLLLGQKTAEERVATFLLRIAQRQIEARCAQASAATLGDGLSVEIPITRAQMAAYLGITIETVSRRLTALRECEVIAFDTSRTVRLNDVAQLRSLAGGFRAPC